MFTNVSRLGWPEVRAVGESVSGAPVGTVFTVNGAGEPDPHGAGFAGDVARAATDVAAGMWAWQPIGYERLRPGQSCLWCRRS